MHFSPLLFFQFQLLSTVDIIQSKVISLVQQGLEMRGFWFQKKSVQLKTVLREVTPL
jgi:hypothetical protein